MRRARHEDDLLGCGSGSAHGRVARQRGGAAQSGNELFQKALVKERSEGELTEAIKLYQTILQEYGKDRKLAARALLQLGRCYERLGQADARKAYERLLREYADQVEPVEDARARLAALAAAGNFSRPPAITLRRVWAGPEAETPGFPSPDGRYFTFTGASGNLVVRDLATGESRRLTRDSSTEGEEDAWGVISRDGKQVAYSRGTQLRVVGFDGSNVRTLVSGNKDVMEIYAQAWSADQGHILAVISKLDRSNQIIFVSVADGSIRVLKSLPPRTKATSGSTAIWASLSPDGRYIVYDFLSREDCAGTRHLSAFGGREHRQTAHSTSGRRLASGVDAGWHADPVCQQPRWELGLLDGSGERWEAGWTGSFAQTGHWGRAHLVWLRWSRRVLLRRGRG